jgi:glycosyltransferase involved in cell wall biosynthesis
MFFSAVIPTYLRPDEVSELMTSLEAQQYKNFEVIIADGSPDDSVGKVVTRYKDGLELKYLHKDGLGISESRNWGVENAVGEYIVFFDSDCVVPSQYFKTVHEFLLHHQVDAYGGPDRAGDDFSKKQKAISYAMTSFYTTGGIRGGKRYVGKYQPRSFNMGIRREVFNTLGGFSGLRVSEDIDLSMRLYKEGYQVSLIESAFVYHKRRSTFYKFFRQVFSFGSGRIDLQVRHGDALKPVHVLPAVFVLYLLGGIVSGFISTGIFLIWLGSVVAYMVAILFDSVFQNRNLVVGIISIYAAFIMLIGYGSGMIKAVLMRYVFRSQKESAKPLITRES